MSWMQEEVTKVGRWNITFDMEKLGTVVRFYDTEQITEDWPRGQFTGGSYYVTTLLDDRKGLEEGGLNLHGGVDAWSATNAEMVEVFKLIDDYPCFDMRDKKSRYYQMRSKQKEKRERKRK